MNTLLGGLPRPRWTFRKGEIRCVCVCVTDTALSYLASQPVYRGGGGQLVACRRLSSDDSLADLLRRSIVSIVSGFFVQRLTRTNALQLTGRRRKKPHSDALEQKNITRNCCNSTTIEVMLRQKNAGENVENALWSHSLSPYI